MDLDLSCEMAETWKVSKPYTMELLFSEEQHYFFVSFMTDPATPNAQNGIETLASLSEAFLVIDRVKASLLVSAPQHWSNQRKTLFFILLFIN